jgi:hypothetical protein
MLLFLHDLQMVMRFLFFADMNIVGLAAGSAIECVKNGGAGIGCGRLGSGYKSDALEVER